MQRFNVYIGDFRTTVCVVDVLVDLLSLKLCDETGTADSKYVVNDWIQKVLYEDDDPERKRISQFIQRKIILKIADRRLKRKYEDNLDEY